MILELETGYLVDAILEVKLEKFNEHFVSVDELLIFKNIIELKLQKKDLNVIFIDDFFEDYFNIGEGVISKLPQKEEKTLKMNISNEKIRNEIYDKNYIFWCIVQMMINKLYNSVNHRCDECTRKCNPPLELSKLSENDCSAFKYNFVQKCIWNIDMDERIIIENMQKERSLVKSIPYNN